MRSVKRSTSSGRQTVARVSSDLAFGTASLIPGAEATAAITAARDAGVRCFDTAPYYGLGQAELALGEALAGVDRSTVTLSTKVGRTVDPDAREWHFDYSRDAVLRSLEASLARLRVDRVDTVYVHDPDNHADEALATAIPTLIELRDEGVIGSVGAGMNQWQVPLRFIRESDLDVLLIAGRYSLLDASAARELFPECVERGVDIVIAGVYNSGILANPRDGASYDYRPASAERLARARAIQRVALEHRVTLRELAVAFSSAPAAVSATLLGVSSESQVRDNLAVWGAAVPSAVGAELRDLGLLPDGAILPL